MDKYVTMKLKNHTEYNKKILFLMINCSNLNCSKDEMNIMLKEYRNYIEDNKNLSIIFDARLLSSVNPKTAWEGASMICKLNNIAKDNVLCSCVIMGNKIVKDLFNTVVKIHPIVVPFKIASDNQDAFKFVTEKMKN